MAHGINTTVIELDPIVYKFATKYFGFPSSHNVIVQDAITFVENSKAIEEDRRTYDYIVHDVFTGGAEPIELFTQEFLQGLSDMLNADGVIAVVSAFNELYIIGEDADYVRIMLVIYSVRQPATLSGPSSRFFQHVGCTERTPILQVRPLTGVRNWQGISPTWSSFAASRVAISLSEGQ